MQTTEEECAAMAAAMLDAELVRIIAHVHKDGMTPLQKAVLREAARRQLLDDSPASISTGISELYKGTREPI